MSSFLAKRFPPRYIPVFLLVLAAALQGAKTPPMFALWSAVILIFCCLGMKDAPRFLKGIYPLPIICLSVLMIAQVFSLDPSESLYPTLQLTVFTALAVLLRYCAESDTDEKTIVLWRVLSLLGVISLGLALHQCALYRIQRFENVPIFGFLPLNPSFNAIWMASLAVALSARIVAHHAWRSGWERAAEGSLAVLLGLFVLLSPARTRSAPLALAIGLIYVFGVRFTFKRVLAVIAFLGILAFISLPMNFLESRVRMRESNYRTRIWQVAVQIASDRPLTGYGLGNFERGYQKFSFPVKNDLVQYARTTPFAHNEYLQAAADLGVPALVLLIFMIAGLLLHPTNRAPNRQRPAKAALIVLGIDAFFNPTWHMPFLLFLTLLWGVQLTHPRSTTTRPYAERTSPWKWLGLIFLGLNLGGLLIYSAARSVWAANGDWTAILRWNPKDATAWNGLGRQLGISSNAATAHRRAVALSPSQSYFYEELGYVLEHSPHRADQDEALAAYRTALGLAPHRAINALSVGRMLYRRGDRRAALESFEKAQALEPNFWEAHLWIARTRFEMGEKQKAIRILHRLERLHHDVFERQNKYSLTAMYRPSPYEQGVLAYDAPTVHRELRRFLSTR